ncbi:hypothetical protein CN676_05785 [Bacillus wiedmannii]|uniref:hypothetical protein n=1 Tax=Bacillus cereus group TaxID=86661 RepID=UPI000BEBC10D|nr:MULTISPECIES: hypothetical protein [Bacillus cereus group]PEE01345.1 hypothetical protein CON78_08285 [Bacillus toyonensis]PEJ55038.1 hypothetical protein CN676_05785 [Bacillus wiedmannii]
MFQDNIFIIEKIRDAINEKYKFLNGKPDLQEVKLIVNEFMNIPEKQRCDEELERIIFEHVKMKDFPLTEGLDMSGLMSLQQQILLLLNEPNKEK